jgi:hypothetical protein
VGEVKAAGSGINAGVVETGCAAWERDVGDFFEELGGVGGQGNAECRM